MTAFVGSSTFIITEPAGATLSSRGPVYLKLMAPGQIFEHNGSPCLLVRIDDGRALMAKVKGRMVYTFYAEPQHELRLVHDPGARNEADRAGEILERSVKERDILIRLLSEAAQMLPRKVADDLRDNYMSKIKDLDYVVVA